MAAVDEEVVKHLGPCCPIAPGAPCPLCEAGEDIARLRAEVERLKKESNDNREKYLICADARDLAWKHMDEAAARAKRAEAALREIADLSEKPVDPCDRALMESLAALVQTCGGHYGRIARAALKEKP